jgi:hypothetical protein
MQSQVLSQLEGKLKTASLVIEQLISQKREDEKEIWKHDDRGISTVLKVFDDMRISKKAKYAIKKDTLYAIVDEIEKWQARYDPTWILIMQMSISNVDAQLDQEQEMPGREQIPVIMAAKGIRDTTRKSQDLNPRDFKPIWMDPDDIDLNATPIPESTVMISTSSDQREMVLIDTMKCGQSANLISTTKAVRKLARILEAIDPSTFGFLKCQGVIKDPRPTGPDSPMDFKFIFSIPKGLSNPQSLRAVLLSEASYPLDERLALAKKITSSILFVHTVQFVHKNIRPETIIVFQNDRSMIEAPFLAGFEQFRLDGGRCWWAMVCGAAIYVCFPFPQAMCTKH